MRSGGHPLARWPVAGAGTCPPCAGCCCAPWPAWPARWRGRTHRLPPQPHPQAAGHAPASSTHAGAGCGPRITGVHAARGEGVHILQRSQDEAPSAGPPTALPPSAWVPVTLPDRWINPGRWPGHDGEVWYRVDWRNPAPLPHRPACRWPPTASTWQASCGWATPCCGATATWPSPCRAAGRTPASAWACAVQARMQRVGGELQVQSAPGATVLTVHLMPAHAPESQPEPLL